MSAETQTLLYLAAAVAFIVGLKRLGSPRTARSGNAVAALGMLLAVVVTLVDAEVSWVLVGAGIAVGAVVGTVLAVRVQMTAMPQLVAAFNGFGGLASALVAGAEFSRIGAVGAPVDVLVTMSLSVLIGAITFTGSLVAYAKLQGLIGGSPITYPLQKPLNLLLFLAGAGLSAWVVADGAAWAFWATGGIALVLGILAVIPIGGADMPVVIALLNSLSGLAAAAAGFVIQNQALIIGGALVGASGLILTSLMTEAMNRSLANVLFGAFGGGDGGGGGAAAGGAARSTTPDDLAIAVGFAETVVVVPGYGLAVSQAQHDLRSVATALERRGVKVLYGIHPVAGRMPGHMNVLLAEADVPYDQLLDLDQTNAVLGRTDVALVLGANDVVNPAARDDPGSPIYGMPILEVDRARLVVVVKRSLSPGFAGIDNPLFYAEGTQMLFSDAKKALTDLEAALETI
ncbi:MAG: NAD(P)(+) transhydrogenase (Re/Si-specific) subunit beta [Acidimicrobiia bacterium]|nr:MAG: NAD(P)(+) transhydrogenase (Re/Si-specific) subunit beta [Acidimicrobiia bacterium]